MSFVLMDLKQIYQRLPLYFSFKRKKIWPTSIFHFYGSRSLLACFKLDAVTRLELTITFQDFNRRLSYSWIVKLCLSFCGWTGSHGTSQWQENEGLKNEINRGSTEKRQDAILMTSSHRQKCLWPGLSVAAVYISYRQFSIPWGGRFLFKIS